VFPEAFAGIPKNIDADDFPGSLVAAAGHESLMTEEDLEEGDFVPKRCHMNDAEITGNAYVLILAGHETVSNVLHFCLLELALNLSVQRQLQQEIDEVCGGKSLDALDEQSLAMLLNGYTGAVINETLRLYQTVITIPKSTPKDSPQTVVLEDENTVTVPAGASIILHASAVHRNPKYWPSDMDGEVKDDIEQFRPARWQSSLSSNKACRFQPVRGSFIPFSEGPRICLGKRFAQVEMVAVLVTMLRHHSLELSISEQGSATEVDALQPEVLVDMWSKAAEVARWRMHRGAKLKVTLTVHGDDVPIMVLPRKPEQFDFSREVVEETISSRSTTCDE
jgi:cytochrome P450